MAVLARSRSEHFGLRPMDPMKDLKEVADLIEEAFANDLDRSGQNALRELRWLSRLKPILWWMVTFNPEYSDFLSGFVWEEDGKIVGNITVNQTSPGSRRWLISNVAVSREYRRRGIGRGLMYAALELVKEYNGKSVALQVRADNETAKRLYDSLQFKEIAGTTYLHLNQVTTVQNLPFPKEVLLRPRRFDSLDARMAYSLASVATPTATKKEWPLRHHRFRLGLGEQLSNVFRLLIGGTPSAYWVVEENERLVGMVNIIGGVLGEKHRIELIVHPDWRGRLEKPLISRVLEHLYPWRRQSVRVKHPADHTEAVEAFKEFGFREEQTLIWMKREM